MYFPLGFLNYLTYLCFMKKHDYPYGYIPNNGDKFSKWTVIDNTIIMKGPKKFKSRHILCKCECGIERLIQIIRLINSTSNGCNWCSTARDWSIKRCQGECVGTLSRTQYAQYKNCAIRRNISWELTMEVLWKLFKKQEGRCAISGIPLILDVKIPRKGKLNTASIDRIDNNKPYTEDNVQWVHKDINKIKSTLDNTYFIELCKTIGAYQQSLCK